MGCVLLPIKVNRTASTDRSPVGAWPLLNGLAVLSLPPRRAFTEPAVKVAVPNAIAVSGTFLAAPWGRLPCNHLDERVR